MTWKLRNACKKRVEAETWLIPRKRAGSLSVCLIYPNIYRIGMSNLGFTTVHSMLNDITDIVCERAFLPDLPEMKEYLQTGTPLISLESQRALSDYDVLAFSISFESDFLNIPRILSLASIPHFSSERENRHPLVIAGGAAFFLNPEPVADFFDLICIGEAENILNPLAELIRNSADGKEKLLEDASKLPSIYVPSNYSFKYSGADIEKRISHDNAPEKIERGFLNELLKPAVSTIITEESEFGDMLLIEVSRGCPRGCRFCAAGFIYHPYRQSPIEVLKEEVKKAVETGGRIGFVGAAVSDYLEIDELLTFTISQGCTFSVSSLRLDALDSSLLKALKGCGHKTVSIAPEGASQHIRDMIKKGITQEQIFKAVEKITDHEIINIKLYFIIGLPEETMDDLQEMLDLVKGIRERVLEVARGKGRIGEIILSVNPFIPKPFTPLQWCGMEHLSTLEKKIQFIRKGVATLPNVKLNHEALKSAWIQALLSRGDRRLAKVISEAQGKNFNSILKKSGYPADEIVHRSIKFDAILPWGFITPSREDYLKSEYLKATKYS